MAIRQYIGARYVPKFMGTYDATQIYEALCIVDNGSGTSYISKIPTPAGTPLTDNVHWAIYGSSSGAITSLQQQINDMQDGSIPGSLQYQIDENATKIQSLINDARRVVIITDSYGTGRGGATPFTDYFQNIMGLANTDYFAYAEGSLGFNQTGDGGHTALTLLQSHSADITDHDSITDVVFVLGGNDWGHITGLDDAIHNCFDYVKTAYQNAKIWLAYSYNQAAKTAVQIDQYHESLEIYASRAMLDNALWVDNYYYIMHNNDLFISDGVHPNSDGGSALGRNLANFMMKGSCDYKTRKKCVYTSVNGTLSSTLAMTIDNAVATITGYCGIEARSFSAGSNDVKIGAIADPLFKGVSSAVQIPVSLPLTSGATVMGFLYVFGGDVYINVKLGSADSVADTNLFISNVALSTLLL